MLFVVSSLALVAGVYLALFFFDVLKLLSLRRGGVHARRSFVACTTVGAKLSDLLYGYAVERDTLRWEIDAQRSASRDLSSLSAASSSEGVFLERVLELIKNEYRCAWAAIALGENGELLLTRPRSNNRIEALIRRFIHYHTKTHASPEGSSIRDGVRIIREERDATVTTALFALGISYSLLAQSSSARSVQGEHIVLWLGYEGTSPPTDIEIRSLRELSQKLSQECARRRAVEQLTKQVVEVSEHQEQREKLFSHFSHDIRSPLNNITAILSLLQLEQSSVETQEMLESALRNCKSVGELVEDLIDFARHKAGQLVARKAPFSLTLLAQQIVKEFSLTAKTKGLELVCSADGGPYIIDADIRQVRRVLSNFISNAIKYTDRGGVTVSLTRASEGRIRLAVVDTGCGLSDAELATLFKPFSRIAHEQDGYGLGLVVAQLLADANGGTIAAKSLSGVGSEFCVEFSLTQESITPQLVAVQEEATILVVDDDPTATASLARYLEKQGFSLYRSFSVAEAIGMCSIISPDFVLTDSHMPDGGAARLLQFLAQSSAPPRVAILSGDDSLTQADFECRVDAFFVKPVDLTRLVAWLRTGERDSVRPGIKAA